MSDATSHRAGRARRRPAGFTLTEMLIVIGLIAVLLGLLLPTLGGVWSTGELTKSMNNMRQIGTWMREYASDNSEFIVPSRFDYGSASYSGKVRSYEDPAQGVAMSGTWSDILHSVFEVGIYLDATADLGHDYRHDSPDFELYDLPGIDVESPFRSAAANTQNVANGDGAKPFGSGAQEQGWPGFFAANNFFDAGWPGESGEYFTNGQIRFPDQSMYLVDSFAGETIDDEPEPFDPSGEPSDRTLEVDFRYRNGTICLMLFLDGHADQLGPWESLCELEGDPANLQDMPGRGVRVQKLTQKKREPCDP